MKKERVEDIMVGGVIFLIILLSLYHASYNGFLGLSKEVWMCVWTCAENLLLVLMCLYIISKSEGIIKMLFGWPLITYFVLRSLAYISCYSGVYIAPKGIWNLIMIAPLLAGLLNVISNYRKWQSRM